MLGCTVITYCKPCQYLVLVWFQHRITEKSTSWSASILKKSVKTLPTGYDVIFTNMSIQLGYTVYSWIISIAHFTEGKR